ncbi:MAG: hypothetical protein R2786_02445 [Flavobacteriaceae bacterium]
MKQAKLVMLLAVMVLTVTSCKKDDDGNGEFSLNLENFAGTYKITSYSEVINDHDIDGTTVINTTTTSVGSDFVGTLVFNANGTYVMDVEFTLDETVVVDNGTPVNDVYYDFIDFSGNYTIDVANETLTINYIYDGVPEMLTYDIVNFNETSATIKFEDINDNPSNGNTYEYVTTITFVRQ